MAIALQVDRDSLDALECHLPDGSDERVRLYNPKNGSIYPLDRQLTACWGSPQMRERTMKSVAAASKEVRRRFAERERTGYLPIDVPALPSRFDR